MPDTLPWPAGAAARRQKRFSATGHRPTARARRRSTSPTPASATATPTSPTSPSGYTTTSRATSTRAATVGEQWVRALHQYYSEPSNYDVIDEKVMIEANMYGLPFYGFGGTPQHAPPVADAAHARRSSAASTRRACPRSAASTSARRRPATARRSSTDPPSRTARRSGRGIDAARCRSSTGRLQPHGLARRDRARHGRARRLGHTASRPTRSTNVKPYKPFPLVRSTLDKPVTRLPEHLLPGELRRRSTATSPSASSTTRPSSTSAASSRTMATGQRAPSRSWTRSAWTSATRTRATTRRRRSSRRARSRTATSITAFVRVGDASGLQPRRDALPRDRRRDLARRAARPRGRRPLDEDVHDRQLEPDPARLRGRRT